jgi:hypothetical protein
MNITTEQLRALLADNLRDNNHKEHILEQYDFMVSGMNFFETELRRYYAKTDALEQENKDLNFRDDVLNDICLRHQELTQWIEEEISDEKDNVVEPSHDFLNILLEKVIKLNRD